MWDGLLEFNRVAPGRFSFGKSPAATRRGKRALLDDFRHNAGADGAAAFADGETQAVFHRDRRDQLNAERHVVARA